MVFWQASGTHETYFSGRPHTVGPLSEPFAGPGEWIDGKTSGSRGMGFNRGLERDDGALEASDSFRETEDDVRATEYCRW